MDIINKKWSVIPSYSTVPHIFRTECRNMNGRSVQKAIRDEFQLWSADTPVFIEAPTGTGKTSFVYDSLIQYALSQGKTVLLVSNRIALNEQQQKDLRTRFPDTNDSPDFRVSAFPKDVQQYFVNRNIATVTYQGLAGFLKLLPPFESLIKSWGENLAYVVFDEVHFGYSDALFNSNSGAILSEAASVFRNAVRIYMTATPWQIAAEVVRNEVNTLFNPPQFRLKDAVSYVPTADSLLKKSELARLRERTMLYYKMEADYSDYRLHFFGDDLDYPELPPKHPLLSGIKKKSIRALLSHVYRTAKADNKWLIFVDNKNYGQMIRDRLNAVKIQAIYFDAETKKPKKVWDNLITNQHFDCDVLIATPVIENGINIWDNQVKNVAIFSIDRTTFIQELGRKRKSPYEIVNVWALVPSEKNLAGLEKKIEWHLRIADDLGHFSSYGKAVQLLWDDYQKSSYRALYYVDEAGKYHANSYVERILRAKRDYIWELIRKQNYMDIVAGWLNGVVTVDFHESVPEQTSKLYDLLIHYKGQTLPDDAFKPIRQAIVDEVSARRIEYIRDDRKDSLAPTTLNRFLQAMDLPFRVKKSKKQWEILPQE